MSSYSYVLHCPYSVLAKYSNYNDLMYGASEQLQICQEFCPIPILPLLPIYHREPWVSHILNGYSKFCSVKIYAYLNYSQHR